MRKFIIISLIITILSTLIGTAQEYVPTKVEISKELVNSNGKLFYAHKVVLRQTLYSISKAYNVSLDEIYKYNPALKEGLKEGQIIIIPKIANNSKEDVISDVKIQSPEKAERDFTSSPAKNTKKYKKHLVKWYETIDDIAQKYNVSIEAIVALNSLKTKELSKKQVLLIPDKNYIIEKKEQKEINIEENNTFPVVSDNITTDSLANNSKISQRDLYYESTSHPSIFRVSIVLPLNFSDSLTNINNNYMDFYSGALLALRDLKKGYFIDNVELNLIDFSKYKTSEELIISGELDNSQLIIGPISTQDLAPISTYSLENKIPLVSPLDTRTELLVNTNPYLFIFPSSYETTQDNLINSITTDDSTEVSLIFERGTLESKMLQSTLEKMNKSQIPYDTLSYGILEGRNIYPRLVSVVNTLKHNKVMIASENEAFVSDVLRNLYLVHTTDTTSIEVYGLPKLRHFEIIQLEYYHIMNLHLNLTYNIDYNTQEVKSFIQDFRDAFRVEPTPFAYQGYDITTYFVSALLEYGVSFPKYIENHKKPLLQSNIKFIPSSETGGFKNIGTKAIRFNKDWSISEE